MTVSVRSLELHPFIFTQLVVADWAEVMDILQAVDAECNQEKDATTEG
jgi:hypothetical protein